MRIIKRGRRHLVISPSEHPTDDAAHTDARSAQPPLVRQVVRFDQLPVDLQRALKPRTGATTLRAK